MISPGLVLLLGAAAMAVTGILGYSAARHSRGRSRSIALTLFGHGALGSSGLLFLGTLMHFHAWNVLHIHSVADSFLEDFVCDFEWSCVAVNAAFIAGVVVVASFVLSQIVSRILVARAKRLASRSRRNGDTSLLYTSDSRPDAYSVALLRLGGRFGLHAEHIVVMTEGLERILTAEERQAVLEHELAHIEARDDRYLPFFHALSALVFFDPFLRHLRDRMGRRHEMEADEAASTRTRNPRALARALLKLYETAGPKPIGAAFLGHRRGPEILERIERLIALAERMDASRARHHVADTFGGGTDLLRRVQDTGHDDGIDTHGPGSEPYNMYLPVRAHIDPHGARDP